MATKYYVVWVGRNPGIYQSWDACYRQVYRYSGASYRSYNSYEEAATAFQPMIPNPELPMIVGAQGQGLAPPVIPSTPLVATPSMPVQWFNHPVASDTLPSVELPRTVQWFNHTVVADTPPPVEMPKPVQEFNHSVVADTAPLVELPIAPHAVLPPTSGGPCLVFLRHIMLILVCLVLFKILLS